MLWVSVCCQLFPSQIITPVFLFNCLQLSCLSFHSSMLNIFAVFWNTGINWMIACKMGWVVGIMLHTVFALSTPTAPVTHLLTPKHNTAAETVNERDCIHSYLTTANMSFYLFIFITSWHLSFPIWWSQVNRHCSTSFPGEHLQSSFAYASV